MRDGKQCIQSISHEGYDNFPTHDYSSVCVDIAKDIKMIHYIGDIMQIRWYEEETTSTLEAFGEQMLYKIL